MLDHGELPRADLRLVRDALRGERGACDQLVARLDCIPRILHHLNRRRGGYLTDDELAEATQDVLLAVWNKLERFDGESTLENWAYGFCTYQMMSAFRTKRRRTHGELRDVVAGCEADPAVTLPDHDAVQECLETLSAGQADVIRRKHFDQMTFEEIAARLAMPPTTAKSLYYRGLEQMRLWFARHFDEGFA